MHSLENEWVLGGAKVEIHLVDERESARIHEAFFSDLAATDVMTFPDPEVSEIIICPAVADSQKNLEGLGLHDEILTYIIHGLLHLCGWDDQDDESFLFMKNRQSEILSDVLSRIMP
ncbi:MAG: rRNA maturation RNase YbeY [Verrucomicrobiota bacterium]